MCSVATTLHHKMAAGTASARKERSVGSDASADGSVMREVLPFVALILVLAALIVFRVPFVSTPVGYTLLAAIATVATVVWTFRIAHLPRH